MPVSATPKTAVSCSLAFSLIIRVSSATFYKFKARCGGLEVSDVKRLKALENENGKLKKLLAEAMLTKAAEA
ncbi:hypothetical protein JSE7799_00456 [Jannaschia seosinensis]|uniref:Transposase n=1 Tax=Jannaschia seosinensis TaxID=313367 RepID=A0A0M7B608_9RHOB|nr:hypothetical protein JSE7799_00456 [Jannaschia seosinensis]